MLKIRGKVITHEDQFMGLTEVEIHTAKEYIARHAREIKQFVFLLSQDKKSVLISDKNTVFQMPINDTLYNAITKHPNYGKSPVIYECWLTNNQLTLSRQVC
jgi:predicted HAD superfamily hydrolase